MSNTTVFKEHISNATFLTINDDVYASRLVVLAGEPNDATVIPDIDKSLTAQENGFYYGSRWINSLSDDCYECVRPAGSLGVSGKAFIKLDQSTAGTTFAGLTDTIITSPVDGNIPIFDQNQGDVWMNKSLSGDVTMSVTGAVTIANSAITEAKINNKAVTLGKLADGSAQGDIAFFGTAWVYLNLNESQILYVSKAGNDSNNGKSIEQAFLTFGAAITAASALTPSSSNRITIMSKDGGNFTENLSVPSWVGVIALAALITGNHTVADNSLLRAFRLIASTGVAITKSAGTGIATVDCPRMILSGSASGLLCTDGTINYKGDSCEVENGYGFGSTSTSDMNVNVSGIVVTGSGIGAGISSTGSLKIKCNSISGSGTGLYVGSTGTVTCVASNISNTTAYNVAAAGATLYLTVPCLSGTQTNTGTVNYISANAGMEVVGDIQTDDSLLLKEQTSSPSAKSGYNKIFPKSDGVYAITGAGTEQRLSNQTQMALFKHTEDQGDNGGTVTAASWNDRKINTEEFNNITGCSLTPYDPGPAIVNHVITLPAGKYLINAVGSFRNANNDALLGIYDIGATSYVAYGIADASNTTVNISKAHLTHVLEITSTKTYRIDQYFETNAGSSFSLGRACDLTGIRETFATVLIQKFE